MAWRPDGLPSWMKTLGLVLVIAFCDGLAEGEQQEESHRVVTKAEADITAGQQHHHQTAIDPAAFDAPRMIDAPWLNSGRIEYAGGVKTLRDVTSRHGDPSALQDTPDARHTATGASASGIATRDEAEAQSTVTWPAGAVSGGGGNGRRRLQDAECAVGSEFTLSSTLYPSSSGCYTLLDPTVDYYFVTSSFDRMVTPLLVSETTSELFVWATAEVISVDTSGVLLSVECYSSEYFTEGSHPSDVTSWFCLLAGSVYLVTPESFGMTCGCSDDPTPAPAPTSPTPVDADSPEGDSGCGGTDSFTITSSQLEEFDGCYQDAAADDGDTFFSPTGDKVDGTLAVFPAIMDEEGLDTRWIVGTYAEVAEEIEVTCVSTEHPDDAHPADSTFVCDLTGTGAYTAVTEDQFGVACGCNSTSSASPSTSDGDRGITSADTPSPAVATLTAAPTPAGGGGGGGGGVVAPTPVPAASAPGITTTVSPAASDAAEAIASNGGQRTVSGASAVLVGSAVVAGLMLW